MNIKEIFKLSEDRPNHTNEIHHPNDFYGHAAVLKKYAKYPSDYQIKASIEHGIFFDGFVWDADLNAPLPAMIVPSRSRELILKKHTKKSIYAIGPMLAYASHYLSQNSLALEKQRLGKSLLAFPFHSTHWLKSTYNIKNYCNALEKIGKDFDSIRICLYWKDVLHGLAEKYMSYGFECVTAGHMYDPMFLPRLKSIIETAAVTTAPTVGTQLGYCVQMNKPHFIMEQPVEYIYQSQNIPKGIKEQRKFTNSYKDKPDIMELINVFSELRDDITSKQRELVDKCWGINEIKSVEQIRVIFQSIDKEYTTSPYYGANLLINSGLKELRNKEVIIFGTGKLGLETFDLLRRSNCENGLNINVKAFMDNDKSKWNIFFNGKKILKPDMNEIEKVYKIIIASCWEQEIKRQLLDMGCSLDKLISSKELLKS